MTFAAGDIITADALNAMPRIIARGRRTTSSTTTTTIVGVLRLDDIPITAGKVYSIRTGTLNLDSSVAADHIRGIIRYTTDGSTPTTTSTILPGGLCDSGQANAGFGEANMIETLYIPAANETLSLLLCVQRVNGTGSVGIVNVGGYQTELIVEDIGEDPGDTGTDI